MEFGIPRESRELENRVGLSPSGVLSLVQAGHTVHVERGAGQGAGFGDEDYGRAGANIVYSAAEVFGRAEVVAKVSRPTAAEHHLFRPGQTIFSFLHLQVSSPDLLEAFRANAITAVAYEMIEQRDGVRPVLWPMSEIAGRLIPIIAGRLLMNSEGGRGTLLGGVPGVPPAAIVIIGGGVLGTNAARSFTGLGAQVTVLDNDWRKLLRLDEVYGGQITTMVSNEYNLARAVRFADVLITGVLVPGHRAPVLVSREMVRQMRPGAVISDLSIDQGGCVATARPTTLADPTYVDEGVIHHCVPNVTAAVSRTTSYAINNAVLPYLLAVGELGVPEVFARRPALRRGLNVFAGSLASPAVAAALGRPVAADLPFPAGEATV